METASFSKRLMAYNLDITVFILFVFPVSYFVDNNTAMYSIAFLFICFYNGIMECSKWQATLGKKQGAMMVVSMEGDRISCFKSFFRILLKFLSLVLFFIGFFMILFRKDRRGLHDIIAGTKVIRVDNYCQH